MSRRSLSRRDLSTAARSLPAESYNVNSIRPAAAQSGRRLPFIIDSLSGGGAERVMRTSPRAWQDELRGSHISSLLLDRGLSIYEVSRWIELELLGCRHSLSFAASRGKPLDGDRSITHAQAAAAEMQ
jgi:hypothetical protein